MILKISFRQLKLLRITAEITELGPTEQERTLLGRRKASGEMLRFGIPWRDSCCGSQNSSYSGLEDCRHLDDCQGARVDLFLTDPFQTVQSPIIRRHFHWHF